MSIPLVLATLALSNILYWLLVGLVAGWLANMILGRGRAGIVRDIVLGIVGAIVGGWVANLLGVGGGGILVEILIATGGAVLVVWIASKIL